MVNQFPEFLESNFWRVFSIWPNCAEVGDTIEICITLILNFIAAEVNFRLVLGEVITDFFRT